MTGPVFGPEQAPTMATVKRTRRGWDLMEAKVGETCVCSPCAVLVFIGLLPLNPFGSVVDKNDVGSFDPCGRCAVARPSIRTFAP